MFAGCRYGGGPTLPRRVISSGPSQTEMAVEVYPLRLQLLVMPKGARSTIRISKKVKYEAGHNILILSFADFSYRSFKYFAQETIGELHRRACEIFDLSLEQVQISYVSATISSFSS